MLEFVIRPYPAHYTCTYMGHVGCFLVSSLLHAEFPARVLPLLTAAFLELLVSSIVKQNILGRDYVYAYRKMWVQVCDDREPDA